MVIEVSVADRKAAFSAFCAFGGSLQVNCSTETKEFRAYPCYALHNYPPFEK